jgi:uncharacterized protein
LPTATSPGLAEIAAAFGHRLHAAGLGVTPERSARFAESIVLVAPENVDALYWVARATLVTAREQIPIFDRVFNEVFQGIFNLTNFGQPPDIAAPPAPSVDSPGEQRESGESRQSDGTPEITNATPGDSASDETETDHASMLAAVSSIERINERPFSELTAAELELIRQLIIQLPLVPPLRTGRRARMHHHGNKWDVRATLRAAHRTGGDPIKRVMRKREPKPRRIVFLADVSGSMEAYSRIYLHLMRSAVVSVDAEAFVFATRLTRLTRALSGPFADTAYQEAASVAQDWSGGTTIGPAIKDFLDRFGRRGMARGAVVVIISDGWETGNPNELAVAMSQLSRLAHHVIWVNPRKAAVGYQPLVGGMAAALPYVDTFLSGHSMNSLRDVMDAITRGGTSEFTTK